MATLKVGDRVRVTTSNRLARFRPGDKGTVTAGPIIGAQAELDYEVSMDSDGGVTTIGIFTTNEVEPDA